MPTPPRVSVIVPVLAEGARISALVDHLRVVGYGTPLEIVVVDGDPAGSTLAALDRTGIVTLTAPRGRASQQNAGAAAASGDILVFLHADTRLPAGALAAITRSLAGSHRAGAFSLSIRSRHPWLRLVAAGANLRSRLFGLPYGDQAFFFRRDLFDVLDGFPDIPIMEDVALMRALARTGERPVILPERVSTSARRWQAEGLLRATARNLALLLGYLCGVPAKRLAAWYPAMPELCGDGREDASGGQEGSHSPPGPPRPESSVTKPDNAPNT
ncbi:MAG: TIGR04283 family arsenosugar biosynthesis glycosyltransferase [Desulfovibrionaceae bacterium]